MPSPALSVVTLDLEGVLVPEIWIAVAETTGIAELRLTTRDIQDYDELMQHRLKILDQHQLGIKDIQEVIAKIDLLPGALDFINDLRKSTQVIILSDTFAEFAAPIMAKLGYPTLFCHNLIIDNGKIAGYQLRQKDQKRMAVRALKSLNFRVVASGDSFNDVSMLEEADAGFFFRAPSNVLELYPQYPLKNAYSELFTAISQFLGLN